MLFHSYWLKNMKKDTFIFLQETTLRTTNETSKFQN